MLSTEERFEPAGGSIPAEQVNAAVVLEAAKSGYELRPDDGGKTWRLGKLVREPVLYVDPYALDTAEVQEFVSAFHLKPGLTNSKLFARDRTTVAHACCVIENRRDNAAFDRTIDLLECALHMQPHGQERSAQW